MPRYERIGTVEYSVYRRRKSSAKTALAWVVVVLVVLFVLTAGG